MFFIGAMVLAAIIGAATGAPGGVVIALFLILWIAPHAYIWSMKWRLRSIARR